MTGTTEPIPMTQEQIAAMAGAGLRITNRVLNQAARDGVLATRRRRIVIANWDELRRRARIDRVICGVSSSSAPTRGHENWRGPVAAAPAALLLSATLGANQRWGAWRPTGGWANWWGAAWSTPGALGAFGADS